MKKKLFGILTLSSVLALASCGTQSNEKTGENTADRGTFITVCEKVLDTLVDKETNLASFDIKEEDYDVLDDDKELTLVKTLVYFVELLYKNDNYPVTVKPVYSKANYVRDGKNIQYNEQAIKSSFDKEHSKVEIEFLGSSSRSEDNFDSKAYFCLFVDYDFEKNNVNEYSFFLAGVEEANRTKLRLSIYELYDGENIYSLKYDSSKKEEITNNYYDSFKVLSNESLDLESSGDFSLEYTKATDDMLGNDYFN